MWFSFLSGLIDATENFGRLLEIPSIVEVVPSAPAVDCAGRIDAGRSIAAERAVKDRVARDELIWDMDALRTVLIFLGIPGWHLSTGDATRL
jgi:hypothetical protein